MHHYNKDVKHNIPFLGKSYPIRALLLKSEDSIQFLNSFFSYKKSLNPRLSLRAWAKRLQYSNPSYLSEVMNGKRKIGLALVHKLFTLENFSETEQMYIRNQVLIDQDPDLHQPLLQMNQHISKFWSEADEPTVYSQQLSPVSLMLLAYINKKPDCSEDEIVENLSHVIPESQIRTQLKNLISSEYLELTPLLRVTQDTENQKTALTLKSYLQTLPCLEKVLNFKNEKLVFASSLHFKIPKEFDRDAFAILADAYEKLILLEQKAASREQDTKLYSLMSYLFPIEKID